MLQESPTEITNIIIQGVELQDLVLSFISILIPELIFGNAMNMKMLSLQSDR